jgi:hypothetical protein
MKNNRQLPSLNVIRIFTGALPGRRRIKIDLDIGGPSPIDPKTNVRPGLYILIEEKEKLEN